MRSDIAILAALALSSTTAAGAAEIPAKLMPKAIAGSGFNVRDLEAQRAWYQEKLGMRLINTMSRQGKPFEYLMGYAPDGTIVALLASPNRPEGPNAMSRLILEVPDAKGLADFLGTQGVKTREVIPGTAYFLADPEGNPVELYTPPPRGK
ncbi:MAG: VOC family protein [Phenylobacterium sp.]|nr:MAG: VOC family protein [Phenylobacterium sp.]